MHSKFLGKTAVLLLLPFYLGSSTSNEAFSGVLPCSDAYPIEIYAVAQVVWREARSEPEEGKRMIVQVIKNRAKHYGESILETTRRGMAWDGRIEPEIVKLVLDEMKKPTQHSYTYWINLQLASDVEWARHAGEQKGAGLGLEVGNHFFF